MTRVFFDMDGVLAEYRDVPYEELLRPGYFSALAPQPEAVQAIERLSRDPGFEVFTLSAVIRENRTALAEKRQWLSEQLSEDCRSRIRSEFMLCGESKADCVPGGIRPSDILIDDYNANLRDWSEHAVAIKLLNGINHRHRTWQGRTAPLDADAIVEAVKSAAGTVA